MAPPIIGVKKTKPLNLAPPKPKTEPKNDPLKDPLKDPLQPGWHKGIKGGFAPGKPEQLQSPEERTLVSAVREHLDPAGQYGAALVRAKTIEDANLARESVLIRNLENFASAVKGTQYEARALEMLDQAKVLRKVDKVIPPGAELLKGAQRIANAEYKSKTLWQRGDELASSDRFIDRRMAGGVKKKAKQMDQLVEEAGPMVKSLTTAYEESTLKTIPDLSGIASPWNSIGIVGKRLTGHTRTFPESKIRDNLVRLIRDPAVYAKVQGELTQVERANLEDWIRELKRGVLAENEEARKEQEKQKGGKNPSPKN